MFEPPPDVDDEAVLAEVRRSWDAGIDRASYLPVGFGAHHWTAHAGDRTRLFVSYDPTAATLEAFTELEGAYAGAVALRESGLEFVLAPLPDHEDRPLARFAQGALSVTPWRDGTAEKPLDLPWTRDVLRRLHTTPPPVDLPSWRPRVGPDLAERLATVTGGEWGPGPYADDARADVTRRLGDIARWTARYHRLVDVARSRPWVAAHGEPHYANQLLTPQGRFLVDWDTLRLAPAEVDLRVLVDEGALPDEVGADREMLELFDLEWRLDEISQYAAWFAAPHTGTRDDQVAFGGLRHELARPEPRW